MEFITEYGLFLAKSVTVLLVIVAVIVMIAAAGDRHKSSDKGYIEVSDLNERYQDMHQEMKHAVLDEATLKKEKKEEKKTRKKAAKATEDTRKRLFVLDFDGDIKASDTENLREEISAILSLASSEDEVVVRLESGGGMVHSYGLAASQLARITAKSIPLTVCVDKVAASGGYMMACVADKIVTAPFAIIGSIGVVAQLPNFHRLLKKNSIDVELLTAGEHKRTLTMFGENTEKGRQKFIEDLEDTHDLFKRFVATHRPAIDVQAVANGDVWYGQQALDVNLVDELLTSDQYLLDRVDSHKIYKVSFEHKKSLPERLGLAAEAGFDRAFSRLIQHFQGGRFFS